MQRRHLRAVMCVAAMVTVGATGLVTSGVAQAAPDDTSRSQTESRTVTNGNPSYTGAGANFNDVTSENTDRNTSGFQNDATGTGNLGQYRTMTNFWNTDVSWSCPRVRAVFGATSNAAANCTSLAGDVDNTVKTMSMTHDSATPEFKITGYSGNTYFPNGRTGVTNAQNQTGTCTNAAVGDICHWTPNNFHFPGSYPATYKGCNFTACSNQLIVSNKIVASAGFPTPMASLVSMPSTWTYTLPTNNNSAIPDSGVFDVAYDIWLDDNKTANLPSGAGTLGQNDGAEVMIWASNHGYAPGGNVDKTHPITPAGLEVESGIDIPGATVPAGTHWDVWINRQNTDVTNGTQWNIVTFVAQPPLPSFSSDTRPFIDKAMTYNSGDRPDVVTQLDNGNKSEKLACPQVSDPTGFVNGVANPRACVLPNWWVTSVQAGFEIWNLPSNPSPLLATNSFSVNPLTILGDPAFASTNTGITGESVHVNGDGTTKPILHWNDNARLSYSGCSVATTTTATATINYGNGTPPQSVTLTQQANSGIWDGPILPSNPGHDSTTITFTLPCGDSISSAPIFVDPSGKVTNQDGLPINGATVTLGLCTNGAASTAPCPAIAANSTLITPNRNSETTPDPATTGSGPGSFRWDVMGNNFWTVTASAPGCTTKTIGPMQVPPPRVDLMLQLTCTTAAPGIIEVGGATRPPVTTGPALPTTVVVRPPGVGPFGYCADIFVTNNTNAPVEWNTSFTVPGNQHINQHWNMVLTQVGNQATNVHADPSNPWNKILQPGQTTQSTGFCAVP